MKSYSSIYICLNKNKNKIRLINLKVEVKYCLITMFLAYFQIRDYIIKKKKLKVGSLFIIIESNNYNNYCL